jgi:DNA modification methylase
MVSIDSISPNPNAPKKRNREGRRALEASVRRFGVKGAILVDRDTDAIVAGNAVWQAAKDASLDEVPIIRVSFATEADRRAFVLAHNKLSEVGTSWDAKIVDEELKYLFEQKYDLEVTGFTSNDLDFAIVTQSDDTDDAVAPDPEGRAVSRLNDLWKVGLHMIYCGDSLDPASYEAVLGGQLADLVLADAPYGVKVNGHVSTTGKHREFEMMSGSQTSAELTRFFRRIFRNCVQFSRPASIHYQFIDWRHVREMIDAGDGVYTELKNICVWDKGLPSLGSMYRSQHEFCLVFKSGRGRHVRNFATGTHGRTRSNIWRYEGMSGFGKDREALLAAHPSPKNVAMLIDAIRDCSNAGDLILDPFCGSGSTAVAAHHAGRRCATIEIDPLYVDASLKRLAGVTGEPIRHADGRTFAQVAADRANDEAGDA